MSAGKMRAGAGPADASSTATMTSAGLSVGEWIANRQQQRIDVEACVGPGMLARARGAPRVCARAWERPRVREMGVVDLSADFLFKSYPSNVPLRCMLRSVIKS